MTTVIELVRSALLNSGAISLSQTMYADDVDNGFNIANTILTNWQLNRWLVYDLIEAPLASTGALQYTVGPTGNFVFTGQRPDKVDAVFIRDADAVDTYLYPFSSREQYDRIASKFSNGLPISFYYDPTLTTNGLLYLYPVPVASTYSIHVQAKASLGLFASITDTITLPQPYVTALLWNVAQQVRPIYSLPDDPAVSERAASSLAVLVNSIAQVPQAVQPVAGNRAGTFSKMADSS